jgi:hypothetical protein
MKKNKAKATRVTKSPKAKPTNPQAKKEQEIAQQKDFPAKVQKEFAKKSGHPYPGK